MYGLVGFVRDDDLCLTQGSWFHFLRSA